MADITITVRAEWRKEEGDGSECAFCGDMAFGVQFRLFMFIKGELRPSVVVCNSCGHELIEKVE